PLPRLGRRIEGSRPAVREPLLCTSNSGHRRGRPDLAGRGRTGPVPACRRGGRHRFVDCEVAPYLQWEIVLDLVGRWLRSVLRGGACRPPSRYVPRPVRSGRSNDDRASRAGASSRFRPSWRERSPEGTSPSRRRLPGRAEPSGGQSASSYRVSNSFRRLKYISSAISPAASFASRDSSSRAKSDLKATVYSLTTRSKRSRRSLPRWVTWYTIRGRPLGGKIAARSTRPH